MKVTQTNAEFITLSPMQARVNRTAKNVNLLKVDCIVSICEPNGGSDSMLVSELLKREKVFNMYRSTRDQHATELKGGLFAREEMPNLDPGDFEENPCLSDQQSECLRMILHPGWHAVCGGPGCGKTHLISIACSELISIGRCVLIIAQTNANLFELAARVLDKSGRRLAIFSYANPTLDELDMVPETYKKDFVQWIDKPRRTRVEIKGDWDLILTTAGGILDSMKRAEAVSKFAQGKNVTVILDEASQVEHISALGLIGLEHLRSHVIICGDPWQVSRIVYHESDAHATMSSTSIMHCIRDLARSDEFAAVRAYLDLVKIKPTFSFLTESFRLYSELCKWGDRELYHLYDQRTGFTSRKGSKTDCIKLYTITNSLKDSIAYENCSMVNVYEIWLITELVKELLTQAVDPSSIVVLSPYKAQANHMTSLLHANKIFGVLCSSIHAFNGNERNHVFVSLTGGATFLDQEALIHSLMTRSKEKLTIVMSRFYEKLPPDHALARFLHHTCPEIPNNRVCVPDESIDMIDEEIKKISGKSIKNSASARLDDKGPDDLSECGRFYSPPDRFILEIEMDQTLQTDNLNMTVVAGSVSFRFIDLEDGSEHFNGKLSDAAVVALGSHPEAARVVLLCQQIAKCAAYLIPCKVYTTKYNLRNIVGVKVRYTTKWPSTYMKMAINALADYSAVPLTAEEALASIEEPLGIFENYIIDRFKNVESLAKYIENMSKPTRESDTEFSAFWANHSGGVLTFDKGSFAFIELLRCDHVQDESSLGQSVFYETVQGRTSFSWLHQSVKSNSIVILFAAAILGNTSVCWMSNRNVYDVLSNCFVLGSEWGSQTKDHLHSLEFRVLGAFAVHCKKRFPTFRLCGKQDKEREFISCDLENLLLIFKKPKADFAMKRFPHMFSMFPLCSKLNEEEYKRQAADARRVIENPTLVVSTISFPSDDHITYEHMLSKGYEKWALQQAEIPDCRHIFFIIHRAQPFDVISDGLKSLQLGVDISRIWGLEDFNQKRISCEGDCSKYSRLVIEIPTSTLAVVATKLRCLSFPFLKCHVLCRWHQFAEGNEIPEQMAGGKIKKRLQGPRVTDRISWVYMMPRPQCLCVRN